MALSKRDKTLLIVLLVVAVAIVAVLTVGRALLEGGGAPPPPSMVAVPSIDTGIFTDPRFQGLVAPRGVPVEAGKTGKANPFSSESREQKTETVGGLQFNIMKVTPEIMKIPDESSLPESGIPWEMIEGTPEF